ncbi:MAG TPA: hypothetical protein VF939_08925 [Puia sp.]
METSSFSSDKQHKKKVLLISIGVGAAGVLGYFGWQFYKKRKQRNGGDRAYNYLDSFLKTAPVVSADTLPAIPATSLPSSGPLKPRHAATAGSSLAPSEDTDFPLRKGSKGAKVRLLQRALIAQYGKSILPKYGADGGFGSEMAAALKKAGLPSSIDESTFNVLTQGIQSETSSLGADLYKAAIAGDFPKVITGLKKISNTSDYTAANKVFKTYPMDGVRKTIVNGLLDTFASEDRQQKIKLEFLRIGLQFNGSQWSLSGLGGLPIITIRPATIWTNARNRVDVPARVVLGNEVSKRLDYTLFENQGQYFLVPTHCVRYI